jgi:TonB family protein
MKTSLCWAAVTLLVLGACGFAQAQDAANAPPMGQTPNVGDASEPAVVHVAGTVMAAKIVRQFAPKYPSDAKKNHVQGTVKLHAIITKDGKIRDLTYVSGPPELKDAAMDAVRQWRYQTTLLAGKPVEVDTMISIVFTLS